MYRSFASLGRYTPKYFILFQHHFLTLHRNDWQNLWTQAFYSPYHFLGGIQNCKCDYNTYMCTYTDSKAHISTFTYTHVLIHLHTCPHSLTHSRKFFYTHAHRKWRRSGHQGTGASILSSCLDTQTIQQCACVPVSEDRRVCMGRADLCNTGSCCYCLQQAQQCSCLRNWTVEPL